MDPQTKNVHFCNDKITMNIWWIWDLPSPAADICKLSCFALWVWWASVPLDSMTTQGIFKPVRWSTTFDNVISLSKLEPSPSLSVALLWHGSNLPLFVENWKDSANSVGPVMFTSFVLCVCVFAVPPSDSESMFSMFTHGDSDEIFISWPPTEVYKKVDILLSVDVTSIENKRE